MEWGIGESEGLVWLGSERTRDMVVKQIIEFNVRVWEGTSYHARVIGVSIHETTVQLS